MHFYKFVFIVFFFNFRLFETGSLHSNWLIRYMKGILRCLRIRNGMITHDSHERCAFEGLDGCRQMYHSWPLFSTSTFVGLVLLQHLIRMVDAVTSITREGWSTSISHHMLLVQIIVQKLQATNATGLRHATRPKPLLVLLHIGFTAECSLTSGTFECLHIGMHDNVYIQVNPAAETIGAHFTFVSLDAIVHLFVASQIATMFKCLVTAIALEWALIAMLQHVFLQIRWRTPHRAQNVTCV